MNSPFVLFTIPLINYIKSILVIVTLFTFSCSVKNRHGSADHDEILVQHDSVTKDTTKFKPMLPGYVTNAMRSLDNKYLIELDKIIKGDFNADNMEDFSAVVINRINKKYGVIIVHNSNEIDYIVFGAGEAINGMTNLNWIDIFEVIPKGDTIAPTLVDSFSGDIIGPDREKEFKLRGDGIYMHVDEASGGGIIYWTGRKYEWYHIE